MNPIKVKPFNKAKNYLQIVSAALQIVCSCAIILFGSVLLFLMAVYGFSNSDISFYTPWLFASSICGVSFAIALIFLAVKLLRSTNTGKLNKLSIAIIILNSVLILLWIATVASEYHGYASFWPFVVYCLLLIPQIVIIVLLSISLWQRKINNRQRMLVKKTEKLILIIPQKMHEKQAEEYVKEFKDYNSEMHGAAGLADFFECGGYSGGYDAWLQRIANHGEKLLLEGWVPSDTYFVVREIDNKIVGTINVRHVFNEDDLKTGGSHIGFAVRPTERQKGYATEMLSLGLQYCVKLGYKRALIEHDEGNIASQKTILKCGGVLFSEIIEGGNKVKRYWIAPTC